MVTPITYLLTDLLTFFLLRGSRVNHKKGQDLKKKFPKERVAKKLPALE